MVANPRVEDVLIPGNGMVERYETTCHRSRPKFPFSGPNGKSVKGTHKGQDLEFSFTCERKATVEEGPSHLNPVIGMLFMRPGGDVALVNSSRANTKSFAAGTAYTYFGEGKTAPKKTVDPCDDPAYGCGQDETPDPKATKTSKSPTPT